jgi:hypothetical protein
MAAARSTDRPDNWLNDPQVDPRDPERSATAARLPASSQSGCRSTCDPAPPEGPDLLQTQPREVRSILIRDYEMRYEITADQAVWILRVWRTREFR